MEESSVVPGFTFLGKQDLYSKVDISDFSMDCGDNRNAGL
jgi:hypothetical protein